MSNPTLLLTLLFLAFFRLLTGLIESTYALGLLQTDIPPESASSCSCSARWRW